MTRMTERRASGVLDEDAVDDVGAGGPALLCVPGWCGDRTVFADLTPRLHTNRRTLAMDLPGHGVQIGRAHV